MNISQGRFIFESQLKAQALKSRLQKKQLNMSTNKIYSSLNTHQSTQWDTLSHYSLTKQFMKQQQFVGYVLKQYFAIKNNIETTCDKLPQ